MCWGRDCCGQAKSDTEKRGREPYLRWQARNGDKVEQKNGVNKLGDH